MNIFDFALEKERYSEDYYRRLAEKATSEGLSNILSMLADEEHKHQQVVAKMRRQESADVAETTVLLDAKDVFGRMKTSAEKFSFDVSEKQLYQKALQIEQDSQRFYIDKAGEATRTGQKEVFQKLAEEEQKHYVLIENIIDFISRPETWLEDAEFYHLEDY